MKNLQKILCCAAAVAVINSGCINLHSYMPMKEKRFAEEKKKEKKKEKNYPIVYAYSGVIGVAAEYSSSLGG